MRLPKILTFEHFFFVCLFLVFLFLGPQLHHMEVPRLGVESALQLLAHATATATSNLSWIYDLHHSSQQHRISDPLSKARDWIRTLTDTSRILCCTTRGTPLTFECFLSLATSFYIVVINTLFTLIYFLH